MKFVKHLEYPNIVSRLNKDLYATALPFDCKPIIDLDEFPGYEKDMDAIVNYVGFIVGNPIMRIFSEVPKVEGNLFVWDSVIGFWQDGMFYVSGSYEYVKCSEDETIERYECEHIFSERLYNAIVDYYREKEKS